ncbi:MAG: RagB/SusD family nutrient uptake outer membrane protein, partial [Bacteroidaceae bacterium]|nr:RagB/SusD family nutrient uptake outer membrane protein [Bacteroidaceae bacterium]
ALVGLEHQGYIGAMDLAMNILKVGVKNNYQLLQNPRYANDTTYVSDTIFSNDPTLPVDKIIEINNDTLINTYLASCTDSLRFNFTADAFRNNAGIHSRGCGDSERNIYYALTDTCIARYLGLTEVDNKVETLSRPITYDDSLNYIADLVIDELALELAWEGTRFGDLIRFAKAMGDNDVLAKRVAGRAFDNDVTYRSPNFQFDAELYSRMKDEANWYLPLPGEVIQPVDPEDIPTGELPNE